MGTLTFFLSILSSMTSKKTLTYSEMVLQAVLNIKDYIKGASRQAITKYIETTFDKVVSLAALRSAIKKLVDDGTLLQEGQRFKLDKVKRAELRKPAQKPKRRLKRRLKKKPKRKQPRRRQRKQLRRRQRQ